MPAAHALDCYFDLEGDPFLGDRGREYLWGVSEQAAGGLAYVYGLTSVVDGTGRPSRRASWACRIEVPEWW